MKVTVFGTGYVGLVQAATLSEVGHHVVCIDVDQDKINLLNQGGCPIYEPGLEPMLTKNLEAKHIEFTTDALYGVQHADIIFIAVGTPPDEDGSADLSYVLAVAKTIASNMQSEKIIITKSTVPVGTGDKVEAQISSTLSEKQQLIPFDVASNPEFLKEGAAINDSMRPDRIIVGTDSDRTKVKIKELYAPFNRNHDRIMFMDRRSAELTKYAANCMLATKISFMNEMANLAEKLDADIEQVRLGIGSDPRIGYHFIYPGCGYGGSCFPKDVQALIKTAEENGHSAQILNAVENVNNHQKTVLFTKIKQFFGDELKGKTIAIWGLAFKPNTDDMREASSRQLMESLWDAGAKVQAYDPEAMNETQRIYGEREDLLLMGTKEMAVKGADALVICTEWQTFRAPNFDWLKTALSHSVIFDGRNLFEPEIVKTYGLKYFAIGRSC
ncbi:MAG: UDP-glucose/GDP-mannose dehydrogenase family protein [Pseudomonadota bacterium]